MTPERFEIWAPRWHDRMVLLAKHRVQAQNHVVFTRAKSLPGVYSISGAEVKGCKVESNGRIQCYAVPLDKLTKIGD